jgi:hypothetical protein
MGDDIIYIGEQTEDTINQRYLNALTAYDQGAMTRKKWHVVVAGMTYLLPYATLLLVTVGMVIPLGKEFDEIVLYGFLPLFGGLSLLGTIAPSLVDLRGRWLRYREAAERLRKHCMLYHAGLFPYDTPDALQRLNRELERLTEEVKEGLPKNPYDRKDMLRYYIDYLLIWPRTLQDNLGHLPDDGIRPRLVDGRTALDDSRYVQGRLRSQQRWHLRKGWFYFKRYWTFQALIGLCTFSAMLYVRFYQPAFWVTAVSTVAAMALFAIQQFFGDGRLYPTYYKVAGNLGDIEEDYRERKHPFNDTDPVKRLRMLVEMVEDLLDLEFERWLASRH